MNELKVISLKYRNLFFKALAILLISAPPTGEENSMMALVPDDEDEEEDHGVDEEEEELFHNRSGDAEEMQMLNNDGGAGRGRRLSISLGTTQDAENLKPKVIVRTFEFWTLWFTFFLNTQAITYINSMYKAYGQTFIKDYHFLSLVGSIAAIFNATGR